jgi:hypothetical protein
MRIVALVVAIARGCIIPGFAAERLRRDQTGGPRPQVAEPGEAFARWIIRVRRGLTSNTPPDRYRVTTNRVAAPPELRTR